MSILIYPQAFQNILAVFKQLIHVLCLRYTFLAMLSIF